MSRNQATRDETNQNGSAELPPLPKGWCWTTLEEIAQIEGGITKDQKRQRTATTREVPYLRVANVQRGYLDLREVKTILAEGDEVETLRLKKGDILFTEGGDRDKLGRGWVWNEEIEDCIHQNHIFRARPCLPFVVPKFVSYHGNFFGQDWFTRTGKQTTNLASINKGILRRFPVPLAPIEEQRRIVAKIDELFSGLDSGISTLERVRTSLKQYRASVLQAAVEGKLTAEWRAKNPARESGSELLRRILDERHRRWEEQQLAKFAEAGKQPPKGWQGRYGEPSAPQDCDLPKLPKGWCWASMDQLVTYLRNGLSQKPTASAIGHRILRINAVRPMKVDLNEVRFLEQRPPDMDGYLVEDGDLLFTRYNGSVDLLGVAGLVRGCTMPTLHPDKLIRVKTGSRTLSEFLGLACNVGVSRRHMERRARTTAGQTGISGADIREMPIPLPPAGEQEQIHTEVERRLSIVDEIEVQVETNLKRSTRLHQSILKRAFEGRLVAQDPDDEPADRLLERIQRALSLTRKPAPDVVSADGGRASRKARPDAPRLFD